MARLAERRFVVFGAMSLSRSRGLDGMTRKFLNADGERHDRFVAMTQQIGALDDVKNFEKAFQKAFQERMRERRLLEATCPTSNERCGRAAPR
jgi:hypothetical protein